MAIIVFIKPQAVQKLERTLILVQKPVKELDKNKTSIQTWLYTFNNEETKRLKHLKRAVFHSELDIAPVHSVSTYFIYPTISRNNISTQKASSIL